MIYSVEGRYFKDMLDFWVWNGERMYYYDASIYAYRPSAFRSVEHLLAPIDAKYATLTVYEVDIAEFNELKGRIGR